MCNSTNGPCMLSLVSHPFLLSCVWSLLEVAQGHAWLYLNIMVEAELTIPPFSFTSPKYGHVKERLHTLKTSKHLVVSLPLVIFLFKLLILQMLFDSFYFSVRCSNVYEINFSLCVSLFSYILWILYIYVVQIEKNKSQISLINPQLRLTLKSKAICFKW